MQNDESNGATDEVDVTAAVLRRLEELERSRSWLARRLDVAPMWLHRRLTGSTAWRVDDLPALARALEVEVATLVGTVPA